MDVIAVIVSFLALIASLATGVRQLLLSRHSNSVPVLIELFREHRGDYLAAARRLVYNGTEDFDLEHGLQGLDVEVQGPIRDLMWFYDNLGVLVVHKIVDVKPVSGYLGGSVLLVWSKLRPLVESERKIRELEGRDLDPGRWQHYFELLVDAILLSQPAQSRRVRRWPVVGYFAERKLSKLWMDVLELDRY